MVAWELAKLYWFCLQFCSGAPLSDSSWSVLRIRTTIRLSAASNQTKEPRQASDTVIKRNEEQWQSKEIELRVTKEKLISQNKFMRRNANNRAIYRWEWTMLILTRLSFLFSGFFSYYHNNFSSVTLNLISLSCHCSSLFFILRPTFGCRTLKIILT